MKKYLREKYGRQFFLIDKNNEIVLKPVKNELDDLSEKLDKYSLSKLKKIAEQEALSEAEENLKNLSKK